MTEVLNSADIESLANEQIDQPLNDLQVEQTAEQTPRVLLHTIPRGIDPTQMKLAYGRKGVPKLVYELSDDKLTTRQKALTFLSDLLKKPENVTQALNEDIIKKLIGLLQDHDITTRQKSTECLLTLAATATGRASIVRQGSFLYLSKLFDDSDDLTRRHVHQTIARVTISYQAVDSFLSYSLLSVLVKKLPTEHYDIQIPILETIYNCIRYGKEPANPSEAIKCNALQELTLLIQKSNVTEIKVLAAHCIMVLCFFHEAKKLSCKGNTISALIRLLLDTKSKVRAAAAGALMSISVEVEGKKSIVKENALPKLLNLLYDKDEEVILNAIKAITNCAEDYRGRFQLRSGLQRLEELKLHVNKFISEAAVIAIQVITWRP